MKSWEYMKQKRFQKIYVEITNICNLKCSFCPETKRAKQFMKVLDFEKIINKIEPYTNLIYLHIKGEPLLHPELEPILVICEKANIKVNITTNATLLSEKLNVLINSKIVRQINISLHSINKNENTDKYDQEKYLEEVFKCTNKINRNTDILISYRLWNLSNIEKNNENIDIINKLQKEYNIENLVEKAKRNKAIKLKERTYLNQDIQFKWPSLEKGIISETGKCFGLRNQIGILVNGDIVPCCLDQEGIIKLGNIYNDCLENIINSKISKEIIQGFEGHRVINDLCKKCGFRSRFGNT